MLHVSDDFWITEFNEKYLCSFFYEQQWHNGRSAHNNSVLSTNCTHIIYTYFLKVIPASVIPIQTFWKYAKVTKSGKRGIHGNDIVMMPKKHIVIPNKHSWFMRSYRRPQTRAPVMYPRDPIVNTRPNVFISICSRRTKSSRLGPNITITIPCR